MTDPPVSRIGGSTLRWAYWAVLYRQNGRVLMTGVITGGTGTPNDRGTVRSLLEQRSGRVEAMCALGPLTTQQQLRDVRVAARRDPDKLRAWTARLT